MAHEENREVIPRQHDLDQLEEVVARAPTSHLVVAAVWRYLEIPDMSNEEGLKAFLKETKRICTTLNNAFDQKSLNSRLKGCIIAICYQITCHSSVCKGLSAQDVTTRIASSLDDSQIYLLALQTLANITKHGDRKVREQIAKVAIPGIVAILKDHNSDHSTLTLALFILSSTIPLIYQPGRPPQQCPSIKIQDVIRTVYFAILHNPFDSLILSDAHDVIVYASRYAYTALEGHSPSLDFIIAGLRVPPLITRVKSLCALIDYHSRDEKDRSPSISPFYIRAILSRMPYTLKGILEEYGFEDCQAIILLHISEEFERAQEEAIRTTDLFQLGLKLGELMLKSEHSLAVGSLDHDGSLPYTDRLESALYAAKALRDRDAVKYADMADIIEIKYHSCLRNVSKVRSMCKAALQRSKHAFWYYMQATMPETLKSQLKLAKLGLQCRIITLYLRFGLLRLAAEAALGIVFEAINDCKDPKLGIGMSCSLMQAFLCSALEDSFSYTRSAPPDGRAMPEMWIIAFLVMIALGGSDHLQDLRNIGDWQPELNKADAISTWLWGDIRLDSWRKTYNTIMERYERAAELWDSRFEDTFNDGAQPPASGGSESGIPEGLKYLSPSNVEEDRQRLGSKLCKCASDDPACTEFIQWYEKPDISWHRCLNCKNVDGALKTCGRCGRARYCDAQCQKSNWNDHKSTCVPKKV